ncbi:MAG: xylose isomerase [Phycisphaerales bacterium]|nr:MAG: xylose isomerase [Phycisphaerales bacterium]
MPDPYTPTPKDRFTFGLWTVGHTGRDPFGGPTRPTLAPAEIVDLLAEAGGVHGVNFHDNDLVPIDATDAEAAEIKRDFTTALKRTKLKVAMATTNLFSDPVFKDGAFTSHDAEVRAYALHKTMRAMDLGAEFGAEVYVFWGGREGAEFDAGKDPVEAIARFRTAIDFLCAYSIDRGYPYRFALEAKPNEPRGHMYFPTTAAYLALIPTLAHPDMVGVNPELAHEHMAGLNFTHAVAQALEAGKLFHIDLNDQEFGRYDQDLRFGAASPKQAFHLVRLLEQHKYEGFKQFDAHAVRTSDREDVLAFARGCMRNYLILKEKARLWSKDNEVKRLLRQLSRASKDLDELMSEHTPSRAETLLGMTFDRERLAGRRLPLEALDQRTTEILLGVE